MKFELKKDNTKLKRGIIILVICLIALFLVFGIIHAFNKKKQNYSVEKIADSDIKYYRIISNGKAGVIDKEGNIVVNPEYNTIKIPNPKKPIFVCVYDYNASTGDYKTKVLGEDSKEILTNYSDVNTIEIKEIVSSIPYEKTVLQYKKDGKYGLIDLEGKVVTKPIYEEIKNMPYREGELIVKKDGKYGVININGGKLLDFKYDYITGDNYYSKEKEYELDGYIVGINNSEGTMQYGYLNSNRKQLLDMSFDKVYRMNNVEDDNNVYLIIEKNGKTQLYKNEKILLDNEYQAINYNEDSKLLILQKDDKYGVTDLSGKPILNIEYNQIQIPGKYIIAVKDGNMETYDLSGVKQENLNYSNVMATENDNYNITIDKNEKYGVISKDGNKIVDNKYNYIQYLFDNYFIAGGLDGKSGVIDDKGQEIIPIKYEVVQKLDTSDIIQAVSDNMLELYNNKMQKILEMQDGKLDVKDNYIKVYSSTDTEYIGNDGQLKKDTEIFPNNQLFVSQKNGKWGMVDKNGNVKVNYQYDKVTELNELGFAGIKQDGKWGVIDQNGNIIIKPTYEISDQNGEPYFIGKYYRVISGYEDAYYTDNINE